MRSLRVVKGTAFGFGLKCYMYIYIYIHIYKLFIYISYIYIYIYIYINYLCEILIMCWPTKVIVEMRENTKKGLNKGAKEL